MADEPVSAFAVYSRKRQSSQSSREPKKPKLQNPQNGKVKSQPKGKKPTENAKKVIMKAQQSQKKLKLNNVKNNVKKNVEKSKKVVKNLPKKELKKNSGKPQKTEPSSKTVKHTNKTVLNIDSKKSVAKKQSAKTKNSTNITKAKTSKKNTTVENEVKNKTEVALKTTGKVLKKTAQTKKITEVPQLVDSSIVKNGFEDSMEETGFYSNPIEDSRALFQWLMQPIKMDQFFIKNWEKTPIHIKRNNPRFYSSNSPLISTPLIDEVLRNNHILFTKNIDITSYTNGVRETHNPEGRAYPSIVWDYYQNDCSVRLLNPQTYIPKLHQLNASLQELFGCFVGMNAYLTPPNSQGFAPHYDDIEAFILQIEGKKRWRLYKPRTSNEYLPRFSSGNFDQSEIGEPIMDTIVKAGDLLYFPRGTIHQGETLDDTHSLHLTLSVYQKNSWGDFLEKLLPNALKKAIEQDSQFRKGLPLGYLSNVGNVYSGLDNETRKNFVQKTKKLLDKMLDHIDVDKAADEMAKSHMHDFLPPAMYPEEAECSIFEDGEVMKENGEVVNQVEIEPETRIRLLRLHCLRLMEKEGDTSRIYYSTENSKEYHEYDQQYLEIGLELAPAVKELILRYPDFIKVEDLPIEGIDNKVQVAKDLWEKCIVITENPLPIES